MTISDSVVQDRSSSDSIRRVMVTILAVVGILVGLVAMHSIGLDSPGPHHASAVEAPVVAVDSHSAGSRVHLLDMAPSVGQAAPAASDVTESASASTANDGASCDTDCIALGMACVMALISIVFALRRVAARGLPAMALRAVGRGGILPRRTTSLSPPELSVLCISRT